MKITQKDLEAVLRRINLKAGFTGDKLYSTPGAYLLDGAYGGWKLAQYCNEHGGQRDITCGFSPKKELYYQMHAFLNGMEAQKELESIENTDKDGYSVKP
jgi:hypothetical protein